MLADEVAISGASVVGEIIQIITSGIVEMGKAIGGGIAAIARAMAFNADGTMSVWFVLILVFAGIGLAVGLTSLIFNWLSNLGGGYSR